jgi:hypothetical protein
MKILRAAVLPFAVLTGCATTQTASKADEKPAETAAPQKLALTNLIPFDVASCGPRELKLTPFNTEVLTGALLSLSPAIDECFVDPANREGATFDAKLKVTVDAAVAIEISGSGPSAAGKACVEAVVRKVTFPTASAAISAEVPVSADSKPVKFGDNPANDVVGKLRLSLRAQCDCYAKLGATNPPALIGEAEVTDSKVGITLTPTGELGACLTDRMSKLDLGRCSSRMRTRQTLTLRRSRRFAFSSWNASAPSAPPTSSSRQASAMRPPSNTTRRPRRTRRSRTRPRSTS